MVLRSCPSHSQRDAQTTPHTDTVRASKVLVACAACAVQRAACSVQRAQYFKVPSSLSSSVSPPSPRRRRARANLKIRFVLYTYGMSFSMMRVQAISWVTNMGNLQVCVRCLVGERVTGDGRVGRRQPWSSVPLDPEAGEHQGGAQRRRKRPTTLACMRRQKDGGLLFDSDCPSSVTPIRAWLGLGLGLVVGVRGWG